MSLKKNAQKKHLKSQYEQYREQAETAREEEHQEKAARYYRQCVDALEDLSELESSKKLEKKWQELAANLNSAADKLEEGKSISPSSPTEGDHKEGIDEPDINETGKSDSSSSRSKEDSDSVDPETYLEDTPEIDFSDVGGMTDLKETLKDQVIDPLERPELYEEYDLGIVNGVLLHGPPGTGKTYITKALAGELKYNFVEAQASDITSSLVGEAADNISDIFDVAIDNQPCLLFLDEIDAIASDRGGGADKTMSESQMITQFLTEMSDMKGEDVVVVGATNLPDEIDGAAWRRFDERVEVPPPDPPARAAVLRIHLRDRPVLTERIDWDEIKDLTEGYSSSDLEIIASKAARNALKQARCEDDIVPITQDHIKQSIEETESSLDAWD
jgi:transitional endoplasmic reticulum ATPase